MIKVGDIYKMHTGEGLRIEEYDTPNGKFSAQVRGLNGEWTEYRIEGDAIKLPMFLKQKAELEKAAE